jgi:KTSC domain
MERKPINTSMFTGVAYDPKTQVLEVEFPSGQVYQYAKVTPEMYKAFTEHEKPSFFFRNAIMGRHEYTKVEPEPEEEDPT